jgi:hypothetical protein
MGTGTQRGASQIMCSTTIGVSSSNLVEGLLAGEQDVQGLVGLLQGWGHSLAADKRTWVSEEEAS